MKTYKTLCKESGEGAYGFHWYQAFQVRRDGRRFRVIGGGFQWRGNEGGYQEEKPRYFDRAEGREILKNIRKYRIDEAKGILPDVRPIALALGDY